MPRTELRLLHPRFSYDRPADGLWDRRTGRLLDGWAAWGMSAATNLTPAFSDPG